MNDQKIKQIIKQYLDSTEIKLQLPFMNFVLKNVIELFESEIVSGKMLLEDFITELSKNYDCSNFYNEKGVKQIYDIYGVNMGAILSEDEKTDYYIMYHKEFRTLKEFNNVYKKSIILDYAYRHVLRDTLAYIKFQKVLHKQN